MRYIGLDLHAKHFSVCVLDRDSDAVFEQTLDTSAKNLRKAIGAVADPKCVVLEESTMAAWAYRMIKPHVEKVVVADPGENRWIAGDENIDDESAAYKLARLLRGGMIRPVHHADEERQVFKEIVMGYHDATRELTRFKNKLKAKFRQHGVHCVGADVYRRPTRQAWLKKLKASGARFQARRMWDSIDHLQKQVDVYRREMGRRSKAFREIGSFQDVPGIGPIRAATFYAIVDTPHRFAHKRKLWTYCGVGIARRESDEMAGPQHLTRRGNRLLKDAIKGATVSAIAGKDNAFARQYRGLLSRGIKPESARLTVARAIVSTLYAMWCKGESYAPRARGAGSGDARARDAM